MRPSRRSLLQTLGVAGTAGLAGCLETLGFERESAWANPAVVEDRPDAVYLPPTTEEMGVYDTGEAGDVAVALTYTFPHRFWLVTGEEPNRVDIEPDDAVHLMASVWDTETGQVLPVDVDVELSRDGERSTDYRLWPMLSQRMGFHYGDNVVLPDEGTYEARVRVGPLGVEGHGAFEGRFEEAHTLELELEYRESQIHGIGFERTAEDELGNQGAVAPMGMAESPEETDHDGTRHETDLDGTRYEDDDHGHGGHPPLSFAPPPESLPGRVVGTGRSGDAQFVLVESTVDRLVPDGADTALVVSPRTPYNGYVIPQLGLTATVDDGGSDSAEVTLSEAIDHEVGHHYVAGIEDSDRVREVAIAGETPSQVARHDGYETAFFTFERLVIEW